MLNQHCLFLSRNPHTSLLAFAWHTRTVAKISYCTDTFSQCQQSTITAHNTKTSASMYYYNLSTIYRASFALGTSVITVVHERASYFSNMNREGVTPSKKSLIHASVHTGGHREYRSAVPMSRGTASGSHAVTNARGRTDATRTPNLRCRVRASNR